MKVSTAIAELREIEALDLDEDEALRLLNEANTELSVRARWLRATLDLGPTVPGQADYSLDAVATESFGGVTEPLEVYVGGVEYVNSDVRTVAQLNNGELALRAPGLWVLTFGADASQLLTLYPTPSAAASLALLAVMSPPTLTEDDAFTPPRDFHRACIEYVQAISIGGSEDDVDRRQVHKDEFERQVARLRARRITRSTGHVRAQMRITGVTA